MSAFYLFSKFISKDITWSSRHFYNKLPIICSIILLLLLFSSLVNKTYAGHGVPLINIKQTVNSDNVVIDAQSDPATCGGAYRMEVEIVLSSASFAGSPNYFSASMSKNSCVAQSYPSISIYFNTLTPGATYKWRVREHVTSSPSIGPWSAEFTFTVPKPKILLLAAERESFVIDVKNKLDNTGAFSSVSSFDLKAVTPTLAYLKEFDAILVWTDYQPYNPIEAGNVLAQYIDEGGGVVSSIFNQTETWGVKGTFNTDTYLVINTGFPYSYSSSLGTVHNPSHPIMLNISAFNGGINSYRSTSNSITTNSVRVADWADGNPLVAIKENVGPKNARRADLNFFPPSSDVHSGSWVATTDGAKLMKNALLWVASASSTSTPTITTSSLSNTTFCVGATVNIPFTINGSFNSGNTFTAQLSNASGSFASPTNIGTLTGTASATISATIPANTLAGTGYRIRVVSSNPVVIGTDNGSNLTVNALPTASLSGDATICSGTSTNLSVALTGTGPWSVTYTDGTTPVTVNNISTSPYSIPVSPTSNKTYTLTAVADANCTGTSFSGSATIKVNTAPVLTVPTISPVNSEAGKCGAPVSFAASATGIPAPTITYKIGENTITSPYFFPVGTTIVTASATNSCGTDTETFTVTVTDEEKPVIAQIATITQGTDADKCGAVVEWPSPMITDNCVGAGLTSTHTSGATFPVGTTHVTYTATDEAGNVTKMSFDVIITDDDAPVLSAAPANITVYTGPNVTSCTATASWPALTATDNCSATVTASHEPGSAFPVGTTTVKYTAEDEAGNKSEKTFTVTVIDNTNPTITAPAAIIRNTDAGKCEAAISNLGSPIFADNCSGATVSNNAPSVFSKGVTTVTWTVKDAAGNTATATQTVTVEDNEDPKISAQADITQANDASICGAVVSFTLPTATDNCSGVTVTKTDNTGLNSGSVFPIGPTYLEYTATDAAGNTDVLSFSVTVTNAEPTLSAITAPVAPVQINTVVNASASIANGDNNVVKATWYWDSNNNVNNKSAGTISGTTISGSYTYTATGVYTVRLEIEDACGKTAENIFQYVVVYDPSGGFVTGGFWINSPAGAYRANPTATGKASGGFVSKYQKGATAPTGNTNFQFKAVGLEFNSTSYEWLVVSGAKAQYKGVGTINGGGNYGFILSAVDGQVSGGGGVDKFRIKIWDKNNGDAIVYDNQLGDADDAVATTAIGGGSIVVHDGKTRARMDYSIEAEPSAEVAVYPNPVYDKVTIDLKGMSAAGAKTVLTDAVGRAIYENSHKVVGDSLLEVDMSGLKSGLYLIQLRSEHAYKVLKVLKQ